MFLCCDIFSYTKIELKNTAKNIYMVNDHNYVIYIIFHINFYLSLFL